jgi:hypothetical protein
MESARKKLLRVFFKPVNWGLNKRKRELNASITGVLFSNWHKDTQLSTIKRAALLYFGEV